MKSKMRKEIRSEIMISKLVALLNIAQELEGDISLERIGWMGHGMEWRYG